MTAAERGLGATDTATAPEQFWQSVKMPVLVAFAYLIGAEAAFIVGTLSDRIFAPFWPPNIILLCALLFAPQQRWWIFLVAVFPAHTIAELRIGMPLSQLLVAYATNALVAVFGALAILRLLGDPPRLDSLRHASIYVLVVACAVPAAVALGGAFVPIMNGGPVQNYWTYWAQWYLSNAVGALALGPIGISLVAERKRFSEIAPARLVEAILLGTALVVVCGFVFEAGAGRITPSFIPAVLYLPLPLILWAAIRFGTAGTSAAVLVVAIVLIWRTLNGPSLFVGGNIETNVFAMQAFLLGLAAPALLLSAAIDEVHRAALTLKESEERLAFAAASARLCLWHFDTERDSFWMTELGRRMFGFNPHEPITRQKFLHALHPEDRPSSLFAPVPTHPSGEVTDMDFRIVTPEGAVRWIRSRARMHTDSEGKVGEITGIFADITDRKAAETEVAQQRRELAHLTRVSMLAQVSGGIAHELTQPLTAILSNAQAARLLLDVKNPDLQEIAEVLDDIIAEDNRAGEVIHRLRGLLKKGEAKLEPVDINDLVSSTLNLLHSELIGRRVTIETDLDTFLPTATGDAVQLQQVILNLLMNAADAMNEVSSSRRIIVISTKLTPEGNVKVALSDRGPGLPASLRDRPFQPFFTTKESGLGLGLSICSSIVKSHGSELHLDANPEGGTIAWFILPKRGGAERLMISAGESHGVQGVPD